MDPGTGRKVLDCRISGPHDLSHQSCCAPSRYVSDDGFRPHGIGIENEKAQHLWESDTNMGAFMKRDMVTGEVLEAIVLPDGSPFPHGASVHNGYITGLMTSAADKRRYCGQKI